MDVYPQSGSFVAPIRPEDVREALLIRTGLEVEAVRRVAQQADAQPLKRLDENLDAQAAAIRDNDMALLDDLDDSVSRHRSSSALNSPRAQRLLDSARALLDEAALPCAAGRRPAKTPTLSEHRRIADAIRTGDPELAGAAMRVHIAMVARAIELDSAEAETQARSKSVK